MSRVAVKSPVEAWTAERTGLFDNLTAESLRLWQENKLREIVAYARSHSRYYGETLRRLDPRTLVLEDLPFTRPADVAADPLAFVCVPQKDIARVTTLTTSGTGGVPKRIAFTRGDLLRTVDFFEHGMKTLVQPGRRVLILMSGETENSIARLLQTGLSRIGAPSLIGGRGWTVHDALDAARTVDTIVGIPGEIIYMCRTDGSLRPNNILLSADYAPRSVIAGIEAAWHCPVLTHYGLTETGFGCAVQCASREGHHLRDAELLIEIVDPETGARLGPGESGEIVLTLLRSEAMPLIRYRTGDIARMEDQPCSCGSSLPRLGRVEGRRENRIPLAGGGTVSIHQLDEILFALPAVRGYNAELRFENGLDQLILTVEADEVPDAAFLANRLPASLKIVVRSAEVDPFVRRAKRRLTVSGERSGR